MSSSTNMPTRIGPRACSCVGNQATGHCDQPIFLLCHDRLAHQAGRAVGGALAPNLRGKRLLASERRAKSLWRTRKRPQPQLPQSEPFIGAHSPHGSSHATPRAPLSGPVWTSLDQSEPVWGNLSQSGPALPDAANPGRGSTIAATGVLACGSAPTQAFEPADGDVLGPQGLAMASNIDWSAVGRSR